MIDYLIDVVKALIPPLLPWAGRKLSKATITYPDYNQNLDKAIVVASGTYNFNFGGRWELMFHHGNEYYPQGSVRFDETQKRWEKEVHMYKQGDGAHFLSLVKVSEALRLVIEQYYALGVRTKTYYPIVWDVLPKEVEVLYTIKVQPQVDWKN